MEQYRGTTICSVRRGNLVVMGGDGQVTLGNTVMKANARKVRHLYKNQVLAGFAGGTADAFTLFERFEGKLEKHSGHLVRAAVEMAKDWRTDRALRRLEAVLAIADAENSLLISGNGDVIQPEHGLIAIGSGGPFAQAAALALLRNTELDAEAIARVEKLRPIADRLGCTMAQLALAWCTKNPHVSTVITGASKVSQVEQNFGALDVIPLLTDVFFVNMSIAIMAGLGFATLLTLIVVPTLYAILFKIKTG